MIMSVRTPQAWGVAVLAAALLGVAALGCQSAAVPQNAQMGITVDEILASPQRYVGQSVVADGQVDRVVAERVIALRSTTTAGEVLAIVSNQSLQQVDAVVPGEALHVSGTVRVMSADELRRVEQQLGIQLDEEKLLNLASQAPFIVAQKVSK